MTAFFFFFSSLAWFFTAVQQTQTRVRGVGQSVALPKTQRICTEFGRFNSSIRIRANSVRHNFVFCQCAKSVNVVIRSSGVVL